MPTFDWNQRLFLHPVALFALSLPFLRSPLPLGTSVYLFHLHRSQTIGMIQKLSYLIPGPILGIHGLLPYALPSCGLLLASPVSRLTSYTTCVNRHFSILMMVSWVGTGGPTVLPKPPKDIRSGRGSHVMEIGVGSPWNLFFPNWTTSPCPVSPYLRR